MSKVFLSVIIPSYDEMANLRKGVLDRVKHFLDHKKVTYEVIVVDDGSKDGSVEFVENFIKENSNFILIKNPHTGKAGAVTTGMLSAKGEYRLFTDMDQATPIEELDKLLGFLEKGYDVAIGSRSSQRKGSPWSRQFISWAAVVLRRILVGLPELLDTQCGFKMFQREAAEVLFGRLSKIHHGYQKISGSSVAAGFDMEILYLAKKMGYQIKEVPVDWLYVESRRVSVVRDSLDGVKALLVIRLNRIKGIY